MNPVKSIIRSLVTAASGLALVGGMAANAYPVDPNKVPVDVIQDSGLNANFRLAYDSADRNIIYYAPKGGRTANLNGMPLIGFAVLPTGEAIVNAQFEFGVFGADKEKLFQAIRAKGKTPVEWPFRKTKVVPLTPGINPETGTEFCEETVDVVTGETIEECSGQMYKEIEYSQKGPALGENIALTAVLTQNGAAIFQQMLRQGAAMQLNLEAEYLSAGTAFSAKVTVDYDRLFQNFHAHAAARGYLWEAELEAFWEREGLCINRSPSECGVFIEFTDQFGNVITTPTIDPDNKKQQEEVFQAIQRFADKMRDEMLTPLTTSLKPLDTSSPLIGYKLNAKFESKHKQVRFTYPFTSPAGVNAATTTLPASIGCVKMTSEYDIVRHTSGDCARYWGL